MNKHARQEFVLRPGVTNPALWYPERPPKVQWNKIRSIVLERDDHTCVACGHRALKFMNVHHLEDSGENVPENLVTICVACHAVLHIGHNLNLGVIEIWKTPFSQVEIVQKTRTAVRRGEALSEINKRFSLAEGPHPPPSARYATELIAGIGQEARAYLDEPLCAIFVNLSRWQLD